MVESVTVVRNFRCSMRREVNIRTKMQTTVSISKAYINKA